VYVHVPFCSSRCDYCAFATFVDRDHLMDRYAAACVAEIRGAVAGEGQPVATSIFFGGGTPSRLPAELLVSILDAIPRTGDAEVTAECNPEDASPKRLAAWHGAGVNRVSFGVQSMVPHVLVGLGRHHDPGSVARAVSAAGEAGFGSISVDVIFGGAGETDDDWSDTLAGVLALEPRPTHVSAYALTVEPGTPLAGDRARHPDDDVLAARYEMADATLEAAGYRWYEVSNWALPGHECRHNQLYWRQGDYRGIGCAAHSHRAGRRWWNVRTPERYIESVQASEDATAARGALSSAEELSEEQRLFEGLALALRTSEGVPASVVPDDLFNAGLVEHRDDRAVLTLRGRLLANEVTVRLAVPSILPA
jgi:putative oxygen-independent coproporphyrinogen III oxidase